ncbi:MAG: hypothetical protein ACREFE_01780 [Limisphaerales bacterium]
MTNKSSNTDNIGGKPACKTRLAPKARELLQDHDGTYPCWVRSPKIGTEFYSGFSRAKLYSLAGEGKIRSVSIREPGAVKGTRLFHLASILAFIEKCEQTAMLVEKADATEAARGAE